MKRKAILVVLLVVMGLAVLSIGIAQAAGPWFTCTVNKIGSNWTTTYPISLTDTAATPQWVGQRDFVIDASTANPNAKAMYAAALTAFANSTSVYVYINSPAGAGYKVQSVSAQK